jgi:integrase
MTEPNKRKLTDLVLHSLKAREQKFLVWDLKQPGLAVSVQPTGHRAWKCIYSFHNRPRWFTIGDVSKIGLADARKLARGVLLQVAEGKDPAADRQAQRTAGTFTDLATKYREYAKRKNKSWAQADKLVTKHLLPRWGKLQAASITRGDVRAVLASLSHAPVLSNQVLAATSAVFSWAMREEIAGIKINPCTLIERNRTQSRERVLSDSELPLFWRAFDQAGPVAGTALKVILLSGQRPGEVSNMRREHIVDGWWQMPGQADALVGWPGTKNGQGHRVWLSKPVLALLNDLSGTGYVFKGPRGPVRTLDASMRALCASLRVTDTARPHDLRRTFSTKVTALGFGREALNRVTNHKEGGIASVYDRHGYADENKRIMEAVAKHITDLVDGKSDSNIIDLEARR